MPTYDYKCKQCERTFEYFQSMSDAPLTVCDECGGEVKRLIAGGSGIIFKGSGFYVNDYKGDQKKSGESTASKEKTPACGTDGSCCCQNS